MAQTNEMIILDNSIRLMKEGLLKGTGVFQTAEINGEIVKFEMPETIHTFAKWKQLGYKVKKGEKSKIKFPIWKYSKKKIVDEDTGDETETGRCFMKMSSFFTFSQVEKIEKAV